MGKVNIDFTPTKYNADDAPDLVTGAYNQSMDDLKTALDNATAEDSGRDVTYPIPVDKGGTNANNVRDVANNLKVKSIGECTQIPAKSDLNEFVTIGNYGVQLTGDAKTIKNTPHGESVSTQGAAFILTVYSSVGNNTQIYITQEYDQVCLTDVCKWIRRTYDEGESWGDWVKVASETDLANYLPLTGGTITGAITFEEDNVGSETLLNLFNDWSNTSEGFVYKSPNALTVKQGVQVTSVDLTLTKLDNGSISGEYIPTITNNIVGAEFVGKSGISTPFVSGVTMSTYNAAKPTIQIWGMTRDEVESIEGRLILFYV